MKIISSAIASQQISDKNSESEGYNGQLCMYGYVKNEINSIYYLDDIIV